MLNDKAEIIWSNEDIITSPIPEMGNDDSEKFAEDLPYEQDADPRRSTLNKQDERSRGGISEHIFIDRDTDISYYDNGSDDLAETASSSSFLAINSANHSRFIIIMLTQYISLGWLVFIFFYFVDF